MPTLSEVQEHAADAEHQAFQRAYDELLNVAKDPITCRHFWDAGRDAMRAELARQEPVAQINWDNLRVVVHPMPPPAAEGTWEALYTHPMPPPDVRELVEALRRSVKRQGFTNEGLIDARAALAKWEGKP